MISQDILQLQKEKVDELYQKLLTKKEICFKSPTGSGKTIMIANLMDKILETNKNFVFIVTTLAKSELGIQNHEKFISLSNSKKLINIKPFLINTDNITSESDIYIDTNYNVYSLTDALFKKSGRISKSNALNSFLITLKKQNKQIVWIQDECHNKFNNFNEIYKSKKYPINYHLMVSATPLTTSQINYLDDSSYVEITEQEAEQCKLIKHLVGCNNQSRFQGLGNNYNDDKYIELKSALELFKQKRTEWLNTFNIRPCMIIQIQTKDEAIEELSHLIDLLDQKNISGENVFNYIYICDKEQDYKTNTKLGDKTKIAIGKRKSIWKSVAKENNSIIDIIIFKMVITEGWDIKRANMLFQIRDSKSETLTEQVIGRIRRNPILEDWDNYDEKAHNLALESYVWGNQKEQDREFRFVEKNSDANLPEIKLQTSVLENLKYLYSKQKQFDIDKKYKKQPLPDNKKNYIWFI